MKIGAPLGGLEGVQALREQSAEYSGQDIPGAPRGHPFGAGGIDKQRSLGICEDSVGPFQDKPEIIPTGKGLRDPQPITLDFLAGNPQQPGQLTGMWGEYDFGAGM